MAFIQKLESLMDQNKTLLCVGLDSDWNKLPDVVKKEDFPQFAFNKAIIDATHDLVCAYKPNSAFYEYLGSEGIRQLKLTCDYLYDYYPHIPIILDAKRGDIGNSNKGYESYAFDYLRADALTVNPYLGFEALRELFARRDKGIIVLCRTSNPGAGEFQDVLIEGVPLYQRVAKNVVTEWNREGNCLLVVGATQQKEMRVLRTLYGKMTFLVPGVGAQGADLGAAVSSGLNDSGKGLILAVSRSVIFASSDRDYPQQARKVLLNLQREINELRKN